MKRKLSKEEMDAFLGAIEVGHFSTRKLSAQSALFRAAYHFVNFYAITMICLYLLVTQLFAEYFNPDVVKNGYVEMLGARALVYFWMLGALNLAFYFGVGFRIISIVVFLYTLNVTAEYALTLLNQFALAEIPMIALYIVTRPFFMLALVILSFSYRDA